MHRVSVPPTSSDELTAEQAYLTMLYRHLDGHRDGEDDGESDGEERRYIGRLGLLDEERDYEPLLIDWRAPAARPFYTATAACPEGVRRRRHIRTRSRTVLAIDDEVLDLDSAQQDPTRSSLTSEAALMGTLSASRKG